MPFGVGPSSSPEPPQGPAADIAALTAAVEQALAVVPTALAPQDAVARAESLLALQERLAAAALQAVADVERRDLWRERAAGSTRTWLRTLPCGDRGQLSAARLLADRPLLATALADGQVSVRTATLIARELARVPACVPASQLEAVLVDGLGDLLRVWAGAACLSPTAAQEAEFDRRRQVLAAAVQAGLSDGWSEAAGQLEPAFVVAARVLPPAELLPGLSVLVDALQPEAAVQDAAEQEYRSRGLTLRRLSDGGWSLRAHLTDETGQLLHAELTARRRRPAPQPGQDGAGPGGIGAADSSDSSDCFGAAGPGTPLAAFEDHLTGGAGPVVQGTPLGSHDQQWHDALGQLLADLAAVVPGSGVPPPASLTIIAPLDAWDGRPGAPSGVLRTAKGDVPLTTPHLRRLACGSLLSAVLLDARGRPVAAGGKHRHATPRERRALQAAWGRTCAVNGCGLPGDVPHHAEPFWKSRETALKDLVPICEHHHHDVHDGHHRLRLRDGRVLDEWGWVTEGAGS